MLKQLLVLSLFGSLVGCASVPPNDESEQSAIQAAIVDELEAFRDCYEQSEAFDQKREGVMVVSFMIEVDGQVSGAAAEPGSPLLDPKLESCMTKEMTGIRFLEPRSGQRMKISYPFDMHVHVSPRSF